MNHLGLKDLVFCVYINTRGNVEITIKPCNEHRGKLHHRPMFPVDESMINLGDCGFTWNKEAVSVVIQFLDVNVAGQ